MCPLSDESRTAQVSDTWQSHQSLHAVLTPDMLCIYIYNLYQVLGPPPPPLHQWSWQSPPAPPAALWSGCDAVLPARNAGLDLAGKIHLGRGGRAGPWTGKSDIAGCIASHRWFLERLSVFGGIKARAALVGVSHTNGQHEVLRSVQLLHVQKLKIWIWVKMKTPDRRVKSPCVHFPGQSILGTHD